jgi:hypothetical protein
MILFDAIGVPLGGLLGFLAGSWAGHHLFDMPREKWNQKKPLMHKKRQGRFLYHVFSLCAKIRQVRRGDYKKRNLANGEPYAATIFT